MMRRGLAVACVGAWLTGCTASNDQSASNQSPPRTDPARVEPVQPVPAPAEAAAVTPPNEPAKVHAAPPEAPPDTHPEVEISTDRPSWWIAEPVVVDGRLKIAVEAEATTMLEARREAVSAGESALRSRLGREPADLRVELIHLVRLGSGAYRAYALVSAGQ